MQRTWLPSFAGVIVIMGVLACGSDPDESDDDTGESSGTDSGSNTGMTSNSTTLTTTSTASTTDSTSTSADTGPGDTSSADTTSDGTEATTDPDTSGTDTGTSDGSSSGEPPADAYPACMADEDCSEPYTLCWPPKNFGTPNFCTLECTDAGECPVPTSGEATPVCEGPPDTNICVLDCTEGECPDGMNCVDIFGDGEFMRCTRM